MARLFPDSFPEGKTHGEKRTYHLLKDSLPDDVLAWFEPRLARGLVPDFVVLDASRGLLILEVKDWRPERILKADPKSFTLRTDSGEAIEGNPIATARDYVYAAVDTLRAKKVLHRRDGPFAGKMRVPFGFGVVLTNFTEADYAAFAAVLPREKVLLKEDLDALAGNESALRARLTSLFEVRFAFDPVSDEEVRDVRGALWPELLLPARPIVPRPAATASEKGRAEPAQPPLAFTTSAVFDIDQEQVARSIGDGHRILRGVAGSGKTVVLVARAKLLARANPTFKILVLCFNKPLGSWIQSLVAEEPRIEACTFHKWVKDLLPPGTPFPEGSSADTAGDQMAAQALERGGREGFPRWDAILIDEAQDFREPWFKVVLACLDPATNSLLVASDDAQDIYRRGFTWKKVGIQASGRTRVLRTNYRNARPIAQLATSFLFSVLPPAGEGDEAPVQPILGARPGPEPVLHQEPDRDAECAWIAGQVKARLDEGVSPSDIAIGYPRQWDEGVNVAELVRAKLDTVGVPSIWLVKEKGAYAGNTERVVLSTIHSLKGLEFEHVFLMNIDRLPSKSADVEIEAKELYVGMTRARATLCMTHVGKSDFAISLAKALNGEGQT